MKIEKKQKSIALRALTVLLLIVIALPLLVACNGNGQNGEQGTESGQNNVTLNGASLSDYTIVFAWRNKNGEQQLANQLKATVLERFGIELQVRDDSMGFPQKAIVIGDVDASTVSSKSMELGDTEYCVTADTDKIYMLGKTPLGLEKATQILCTEITAAESHSITVSEGEKQSYADDVLNTMTFNVRHWDQDTSIEYQRLQTVVKETMPDVIGFQEITEELIGKIMEDSEISSLYAYVGQDRGDYTHEQAAIFYRKDKFNLIESKTRWLYGEDGSVGSDTVGGLINTEEELVQSAFGFYYRIYTYAMLERKSDNQRMVFVSTHLEIADYLSEKYPNPDDVKNKQIEYVVNFAKQMQAQGYPVILTGDFNAKPDSLVCSKILSAGFIRTETASKNFVTNPQEAYDVAKAIDHIFVLADNCYFDTYTVLNKKFLRDFPSDHHPRLATFVIG